MSKVVEKEKEEEVVKVLPKELENNKLLKELDTLKELIIEEYTRNQKDRESFERQKSEFDKMTPKLTAINKMIKEKVKLNVGGKIFHTTYSTLTKYEGTLFNSLLGGWKNDPTLEIFIDRAPDQFGLILDFFRKEKLNLKGLADRELADFYDEVEYYQLQCIKDFIQAEKESVWEWAPMKNTVIKDDVVSRSGGSSYYLTTVAKNVFEKGKHTWKIEILNCKSQRWNMVGVIQANYLNDQNNGDYLSSTKNGWGWNGWGCARHNSGSGPQSSDNQKEWVDGDIFTIELDLDKHTMTMKRESDGFVFDPLTDVVGPVQPSVCFEGQSSSTSYKITPVKKGK